jgi:hypothetical protein
MGSWLTVKEQVPTTYARRFDEARKSGEPEVLEHLEIGHAFTKFAAPAR